MWIALAVVTYLVVREAVILDRTGHTLSGDHLLSWSLLPFTAVGLVSWLVWATRWVASRRYRPIAPSGFRPTVSVLVPSYREDPEVLRRCLGTWLDNDPDELIIVVDVDDTEVFAMLDECDDERLSVIAFKHSGKRSAMGVAMRAAQCEIVVFADSDTAWEPGLIDAVVAPFEDPRVGGVGTRQNAFLRGSSKWRIVADWQINTRYLDYVPAESLAGAVTCLSGRTAAYRRAAILPNIEDLEHEIFFGRQCIAGDDGRLTWLVLKDGWKTVYQSNALAISMFPNSGRAYFKQRIRWSRNSYRCYTTALLNGWMWRVPLPTRIRALQILLTPLTQAMSLFYIYWYATHAAWLLAGLGVLWLFVSRMVRSISHLRERPADIRYLPLLTLAIIAVALPIKTYALFTMNRQGWLTRSAASIGGDGQSEATLVRAPAIKTAGAA